MGNKGDIKVRGRVMQGDEIAMGPGKAALLEAIGREGSISAAGRALGMSYRRTWMLVDTMNRCWAEPLVSTTVGGRAGAQLTPAGRVVLADYQAMMARVEAVLDGPEAQRLLRGLKAPE